MPGLPTGTVTLLFTDIEGSTTLLQRLGDRRYAEVLEEQRRLLRAAFAEGNGREVDTQGDAFLVAFSRARDAVGAAVAAQQALTRHAWPDSASLRVRMGLHTGEPVSETGGYVGLDVHRAARIGVAGHGGQVLLSQAVAVLAAPDLPAGVSLRDLGTHRLKDLREPEHLFQVAHPDLPRDFPPLKSLDARPNNLPIQLTSFVGRVRESAEVKRLLGAARLVTLTGSGGAGKTRLALQVAADMLESYPDGVWLAEFASIADPNLVPKTVATALNVPEQPGRRITETLVDALRPKALLLLLDNCEHLLAACADLAAALLRAGPHVRILATSREGLGIPGEIFWRVPSLSLPDARHLPASEDLVLYDAVRLFVDRAAGMAPGFTVANDNARAVAQICQRLDGIPLAIELAAARLKVLAVEQIAVRLDDRFRLLTGGSRAILPRHQTLRATIDWSYNLLSEEERVLLRRLSVFAGGWTLEAAEAVCADEEGEATIILDLLASLVDKSLVLAEPRRGQARYRLLETVRQYARDRLIEADEVAEVRTKHRTWCLRLAAEAEVGFLGAHQRFRQEHDNLRAALVWGREDPGGAAAMLRLVGTLAWFSWWLYGNLTEAREWLEEALKRRNDVPRALLPEIHGVATHFAWRLGDVERAERLGQEGLAIARDLDDKRAIALLQMNLGILAMQRMAYGEAAERMDEAARSGREAGDKWRLSICLSQQGILARNQGNLGLAADIHTEALALNEQIGDPAIASYTLRCLGIVALQQGDYQRAAELFAESLRLSRDEGLQWIIFECLRGLASVSTGRERYGRAAQLFAAAEALREAMGHRPAPLDQAYYDQRLGSTRSALGEAAFAAACAEGRAMTLEQAIEYALDMTP